MSAYVVHHIHPPVHTPRTVRTTEHYVHTGTYYTTYIVHTIKYCVGKLITHSKEQAALTGTRTYSSKSSLYPEAWKWKRERVAHTEHRPLKAY